MSSGVSRTWRLPRGRRQPTYAPVLSRMKTTARAVLCTIGAPFGGQRCARLAPAAGTMASRPARANAANAGASLRMVSSASADLVDAPARVDQPPTTAPMAQCHDLGDHRQRRLLRAQRAEVEPDRRRQPPQLLVGDPL